MHYSNGREVNLGDPVIGRDWQGLPVAGVVVKVNPGSETCNMTIAPVSTLLQNQTCKEFLHLDDALKKQS